VLVLVDPGREERPPCLAEGTVWIENTPEAAVDTELAERLRRYFQLTYALVVSGPFADTPALREALGRAAADLLPRPRVRLASATSRLAGRAVVIRTGRAGSRRRAAGR
jgi:hypothetical protein